MRSIEELNKSCAVTLQNLRKKSGLSVSKMADLMNVDRRTWQRYENGESYPSLPEFVSFFLIMKENAFVSIMEYLYPEIYISSDKDHESHKKALLHYLESTAPDLVVDELFFLFLTNHGSSSLSQMQVVTMINHLPMDVRLACARNVKSMWNICESRGDILNEENTMPDVDLVSDGIEKGAEAVAHRQESYATV